MTLQQYVSELSDPDASIDHPGLLQLSSLSNAEVREVMSVWSGISTQRRCEILQWLTELADDNLKLDFTAVYRACLRDMDDDVRANAARGVSDCDDRTIIRPLIEILLKDKSADVRAEAATSLGKFAEFAQEGKVLRRDGEKIRTALLEVIGRSGESMESRRRAIEAVASFNSPQVEDIIREAYYDGDLKLKQSAVFAMGRSSDSRWLPIVIQDTRNEEPSIRFEAANACGYLGDAVTVPHLIAILEDDDAQVQLAAVKSLGLIGGSLAKRALIQCLTIGDETIEEAATAALGSIEFDEDPLGFTFEP